MSLALSASALADIERAKSDLTEKRTAAREASERIKPILDAERQAGEALRATVCRHLGAMVVIGRHFCADSPVGTCLYDQEEDPTWDTCLVCGHPSERK